MAREAVAGRRSLLPAVVSLHICLLRAGAHSDVGQRQLCFPAGSPRKRIRRKD